MATRQDVFKAIDSEREYQDSCWKDDRDGSPNPLSIGEFILLIEDYAARARANFTREKKPEMQALCEIRKIAGIAVNCMEQHGAPLRPL